MQKYDIYFWIAQGLSLVSIGIFVYSWSHETREDTLKFQIIGNIVNISSYLFLGGYTAVALSSVTLTRNFVYRSKTKNKWRQSPLLMYVFMVVLVVGTLYTWKGAISLFPCVACILGTYSISLENTIKMKQYMFLANALWIPYNVWIMAYIGILGSLTLCAFIWIFLKKEKAKRLKN